MQHMLSKARCSLPLRGQRGHSLTCPRSLPLLGRTTSPYQPALYVPLLLLHASLLLRVVGDLMGWWTGRQWGGLLNALAVLLFLITLARGVLRAR